jgi:hypothetical protein
MPSVSGQIRVVVIASLVLPVSPVDNGDVRDGVDTVEGVVKIADGVDTNVPLVYLVVPADVVEPSVIPVVFELMVNVGVEPLIRGGTVLLVTIVVAVDGV